MRRIIWLAGLSLIGIAIGLFLLDRAALFYVDSRWFVSLGYLNVLLIRLISHRGLGLIGFIIALSVLSPNLRRAWQRPEGIGISSIVLLISLGYGWLLGEHWFKLLSWWHHVRVGSTDPILNRDLGFYLFSLPFWEALQQWTLQLIIGTLAGAALIYLVELGLAMQRVTFSLPLAAQRHLLLLLGSLFLGRAWGHWLSRYELLYSLRGAVFGAGYTDVYMQMPINTFMTGVALLTAAGLIWIAIKRFTIAGLRAASPAQGGRGMWFWSLFVPIVLISSYSLTNVLVAQTLPNIIQSLVVLPNELEREQVYIEHNIHFTRQGFGLTDVEVRPFSGEGQLDWGEDLENHPTIQNIPLWDPEPLLTTYRQLQEIRPYYEFTAVDTDRYWIEGKLQQVMLAGRELDYEKVAEAAQTWLNQRFFYTHGYGLALSPVNLVTREGLPAFYVSDIPPEITGDPSLQTRLKTVFQIDQPSIYYGELPYNDVFVSTSVQELDYAAADQNIYGHYQGSGGIQISSYWQRILLAWALRDPHILLSRQFTPTTRVLLYRQIKPRVERIAPFLRYDRDPYLVIADGKLFWILDAYTTSDRYPYSQHAELPYNFNYIRNAVKVVIDAYHGSVDFYLADPDDPLIKTYAHIFPDLFKSIDHMPASLRSHIRYPKDLFDVQTRQYRTYHMKDPQVFYNREDQWEIPNEFRNGKDQPITPQYLVLELPDSKREDPLHRPDHSDPLTSSDSSGSLESLDPLVSTRQDAPVTEQFILLFPFTPANRDNLIAWMAAGCDGENYGDLIVYEFSRQRLIFGPQQVEARINQNPMISEQLSLWNDHGSRVTQGRLLVLPINNALLYIQLLYLEAEVNRLPQVIQVIAAYEDQVVMRPTLKQALQALFEDESVDPVYHRDLHQRTLSDNPAIHEFH